MTEDLSEKVLRPLVTAHRGASADYPENTLAAFEAGLQAGADLSECDVHRSADGRLMVIHDDTVDRTTDDTGRIGDMTAQEIQALDAGGWKGDTFSDQQIPELDSVIELHRGHDAHLTIEIKDYSCTEDVIRLVNDTNSQDFVSLCSFSFEECVRARELAPEIPVAFIYAGQNERLTPQTLVKKVIASHIQALSVHHSLASEALVYECRLRGIGLWVWTVDDETTITRLQDLGIQNIVTNRPSLALQVVGQST